MDKMRSMKIGSDEEEEDEGDEDSDSEDESTQKILEQMRQKIEQIHDEDENK